MVQFGMIEMGYTLFYQVLNTVLMLLIIIGLSTYLIKRKKRANRLENQIESIEKRLKAIEDKESI